jgi:hypothetical protein
MLFFYQGRGLVHTIQGSSGKVRDPVKRKYAPCPAAAAFQKVSSVVFVMNMAIRENIFSVNHYFDQVVQRRNNQSTPPDPLTPSCSFLH